MSGRPPAGIPAAGISKSAAKKRNKKASKASAGAASAAAQAGSSAEFEIDDATANAAAADAAAYAAAAAAAADHGVPGAADFTDPAFFNFPPGAYPIDVQYDTTYYDQHPPSQQQGTLPLNGGLDSATFNFQYNYPGTAPGGAAAGGAAGGLRPPPHLNQLAASLSLNGLSGLPGFQGFGAAAGAQAGNGNSVSAPWPANNPLTNPVVGTNLTHEDLFLAANELYKRMGEADFGMEDPYWASLTPNIRAFVREAVPGNGGGKPNGGLAQHDIHSLARRIVSAASDSMGLNHDVQRGVLASVHGQTYGQHSQSLSEELGFHRHPDARDDEYEDEDDYELEDPDMVVPNGDAPSKKKKKNKKKKQSAVEPPPAVLPPPAVKQPPRQPAPHPPHPQHQQQQPALHPPPPPVTPAPTQPPPGSRAAGKQPMTNAPAAAPQHRSARAAGKAPATAAPAHNHHHHNAAQQPAATKTAAKGKAPANQPPAKIWTQSSAEERDHIRQFWLGLQEAERRDLLQIERDAVLRKMKDQHRNSCGCAVCGRKKVNIEMELNSLYEQYYAELRQYANEQRAAMAGARPTPRGAGPFPGSVEVDSTGAVTKFDNLAPDQRSAVHDDVDDEGSEEYDDEEYEDEDELDEDDVASDDADAGDDLEDPHPPPATKTPGARKAAAARPQAPRPEGSNDFHSFGNNLATIKGGILTVADDLLQNNGARFLEMMEQLAVARSVREEQNIRDIQEETDEEDYDEDRDEPLTEADRMEEGRRMFQIFAARMFEQRVLQAYREKVAKQREEQLLRELEDEEEEKKAREEKRAKEAQKKKDKKRLQKEKADREKAEREEEAARAAAEAKAKKEEEERERARKQEEERQRRELVKKQAAEEQARQAAERKKRQQEEKEREEEAARKKREKEEKAKREREAREKELKEKEKREREEKAAREKAEQERLAKEKAEKAERDRIAREKAAEKEKERQAKLAEERAEKARKEEAARKEREAAELAKAQQAAAAKAAEKASAEKAAAERAAAERAAADKAAQDRARAAAAAPPVVGQGKPIRNGPTPHTTPPLEPASSSSSARPTNSRLQKTPQAFLPQPIPAGSFPTRMPVGPTFAAQGFRPAGFSSAADASPFGAAPVNGSAVSPHPPTRSFQPEPSPPFDLPRTAPIGVGFPSAKASSAQRMPSMDDAWSPPAGPIGVSQARVGSLPDVKIGMAQPRVGSAADINQLGLGSLSLDDGPFRRDAAPIGAPPSRPSVGSIGRPYLDSNAARNSAPAAPERILGSAALLSTDDEIVQTAPSTRRPPNGWPTATPSMGLGAAPGTGASRWSSAHNIWSSGGGDPAGHVAPRSWGMPPIGERSASVSQPTIQPRNPSFGAASLGALGGGLGGGLGSGSAAGFSPFGGGVFSPPPAPGLQQQLQQQQQQQQQSQQPAGSQHR